MNVKLAGFALGIAAATSLGAMKSSRELYSFFDAYATSQEESEKQKFEAKYGVREQKKDDLILATRVREQKKDDLILATYDNISEDQEREMKKFLGIDGPSVPGKIKGGGMIGRLFKVDEPTVDQNSQIFKSTSEVQAGLNFGKSVDPNKASAAAQGRQHGVAAGILLGPVNWLALKILCNSNNPQIGVGALVLVNTLGFYNLRAQCTYPSDVCLREYDNKKSFWIRLILGSTLALKIATTQID